MRLGARRQLGERPVPQGGTTRLGRARGGVCCAGAGGEMGLKVIGCPSCHQPCVLVFEEGRLHASQAVSSHSSGADGRRDAGWQFGRVQLMDVSGLVSGDK